MWSISRHKVVVMLLDLEELEILPTNKIEGFSQRIKKMIPSLMQHHCSEGREGGFFERVDRGTWIGHVMEHIALEIQTLAGMHCGFGQTRGAGRPGLYHVVFSYVEEKAGLYAAEAAFRKAMALAKNKTYEVESDIRVLKEIYLSEKPGPSTDSIIKEAERRNIPVYPIKQGNYIQLGMGKNQQLIQATTTSRTSSMAVELACDKERCKLMLENRGIPVARGSMVYTKFELKKAIHEIGFPLVTKPNNGNQGNGTTTNIQHWEAALKGFEAAYVYSSGVMVEKFVHGSDYRLLVVNKKFVAAAKRTAAMITGDGLSTVQQLIDQINSHPFRGQGHGNILTRITVDTHTREFLQEKGYDLHTILQNGEKVYLKRTANLSTGGTAEDVTDLVHPANIALAERIALIVGLDICGIDIIAPCVSVPFIDNGGVVIEVNAAPGFRMHLSPSTGQPHNVAKPVVDMLFPEEKQARIPIVAVTGTNGKTTTTRLIAHFARQAGNTVGCTTSDGVYIDGHLVKEGDCTGPVSTEMVLQDPAVDFAVLECARGGILKSGLRFSQHDIGIVTNITSDHLGLNEIHTLEDLARVKSVVVEAVKPTGYAILNADDEITYKLKNGVKCKVALFSLNADNQKIIRHCAEGGMAAVQEGGYVILFIGSEKRKVEAVKNIPLTFGGKASFMTENVLAGVLAGYLSGFSLPQIKHGLNTFLPSSAQTPGRMNLFKFADFEVMIDYAHNPAGLKAIGKFLNNIMATSKVGVIAGVGDRRDEDIRELGRVAAEIFDEIIIRNDKTPRDRKASEINELLMQGIQSDGRERKVRLVSAEQDSIHYVIKFARPGSFIVICSEAVSSSLKLLASLQSEEIKTETFSRVSMMDDHW